MSDKAWFIVVVDPTMKHQYRSYDTALVDGVASEKMGDDLEVTIYQAVATIKNGKVTVLEPDRPF